MIFYSLSININLHFNEYFILFYRFFYYFIGFLILLFAKVNQVFIKKILNGNNELKR